MNWWEKMLKLFSLGGGDGVTIDFFTDTFFGAMFF
jgi:hypothetical protein